ncbi:conserved exported hypothetical protein [Candidatus Sulfopaludibacter sp. SbA3]|nr:conserved exported hypothetical protein [Candidatus Sulfopaludibacter sp. SbA3]
MKRIALGIPLCAALAQAALVVSPAGPISSLTAARDAIRELRRKGTTGTVTVQIQSGWYELAETFALAAEDSDVVYEAAPGAHPVFSGGRKITGWQKGSGPIWTAGAPWMFRQLFLNGRRAQRARTPVNGFFRIDGPSSQDKPFLLKFRGDDVKAAWAGNGAEVVALLAWAELRMPIVSVDPAAHTAVLTGNPRPSNKEKAARYWIENTPDALDAAGAWYLDRAKHTVSYWPLAGENLNRDPAIAPALTQLVRLEGVKNVTFRGLDFRHADWSMEAGGYADGQAAMEAASAFEATGAEQVTIDHCAFSQSGGYAIWFGRGCKRNKVTATAVFDMGAGGIKIGEMARRTADSDQTFDNTLADNDLHDLGLVYPSAVGIWVGQSSRNTITHNHVHDLFYTAISVGWTWGYGPNSCAGNLVEFNHLHHIGKGMMSDMGAIYTLGVQPGTIIRNNLIHDVESFTYGGWGIYPDEGSSEMSIESNIVYRTKSAGFHQHYGRENMVRNNIFAFGREYQLMRTRAEDHISFTFAGNIIYFDSGTLLGGNWSGGGFQMTRNLYWDARGDAVKLPPEDAASVVADPGFVNAGSYDFTVKPDSPAWKLGWKTIDISTAGPRVAAGTLR